QALYINCLITFFNWYTVDLIYDFCFYFIEFVHFPKSSTANLRIFKKSSSGIGFLNNLNMVSCCSFNCVSIVVAMSEFTKNKVNKKKHINRYSGSIYHFD